MSKTIMVPMIHRHPRSTVEGAKVLPSKGVGMKAVCSKCGHNWYINKKMRTCGCLTCKGSKRKSTELVGTGDQGELHGRSGGYNRGGRFAPKGWPV